MPRKSREYYQICDPFRGEEETWSECNLAQIQGKNPNFLKSRYGSFITQPEPDKLTKNKKWVE